MAAVVGALNESLTESLKGIYKLRKAYAALDAIAASEQSYLERKGIVKAVRPASGVHNNVSGHQSLAPFDRQSHLKNKQTVPGAFGYDSDDDDHEFFDASEATDVPAHMGVHDPTENTSRLSLDSHHSPSLSTTISDNSPQAEGPDPTFFTNPIDAFIHSGTALNYGLLLTLLSIVPPSFSKILSIVGFRGDRERGLKLLWQATRFDNVNGAIAGLALLGYYTNVVSFADILPEGAYPVTRLKSLLESMRVRFPQSRMWLLEEARMLASEKQIERAVAMVRDAGHSKLKQIEALQYFETSLNYMYLHEYTACADSFVACVGLNNWSHALYYYIAGAAHVELYRNAKYSTTHPDAAKAAFHADKAEALLRKVPEAATKKKFMARQAPFDAFTGRKLAKWMAREKELDVRLVDAVGVSPIEEIIYFWGGFKRMRPEQLEMSLARLAWSDGGMGLAASGLKANPRWAGESVDERAILAFLRAAVLRHLGRRDEAKRLLQTGIIDVYKWEEFKGGFKDNWPAPVARYEMAVNLWQDRGNVKRSDKELLSECSENLESIAGWERYDLDARIGMKVTTSRGTLRKMGYGSGAVGV